MQRQSEVPFSLKEPILQREVQYEVGFLSGEVPGFSQVELVSETAEAEAVVTAPAANPLLRTLTQETTDFHINEGVGFAEAWRRNLAPLGLLSLLIPDAGHAFCDLP